MSKPSFMGSRAAAFFVISCQCCLVLMLSVVLACSALAMEQTSAPKVSSKAMEPPKEQSFDAASYFQGAKGTAVLYTPHDNTLKIYNKNLALQEFSPFSTFKIASTLLGLEQGLLHNVRSKMQYNGKKYWLDAWNKDVTLQEAFQYSCVWYYHQFIYKLSPKTVAAFLKKIHYGNQDISEWRGTGRASMEDLNGFWLDSSLRISPVQQVFVVADIFEGKTGIASTHIALVHSLMRQKEQVKKGTIYGKTGANGKGKSWFVGFIDAHASYELAPAAQRVYFAVFVDDPKSGVRHAREVALRLLAGVL